MAESRTRQKRLAIPLTHQEPCLRAVKDAAQELLRVLYQGIVFLSGLNRSNGYGIRNHESSWNDGFGHQGGPSLRRPIGSNFRTPCQKFWITKEFEVAGLVLS